MKAAALMLDMGGIFLQHDTVKFGDFGQTEKMQEFAKAENLGLELVECSEPIQNDSKIEESCGKMVLLVWKRTSVGYKTDYFQW